MTYSLTNAKLGNFGPAINSFADARAIAESIALRENTAIGIMDDSGHQLDLVAASDAFQNPAMAASAASCLNCGQSVASRIDAKPVDSVPVAMLKEALRDVVMAQYHASIVAKDSYVVRAVQNSLDSIYSNVLRAVELMETR